MFSFFNNFFNKKKVNTPETEPLLNEVITHPSPSNIPKRLNPPTLRKLTNIEIKIKNLNTSLEAKELLLKAAENTISEINDWINEPHNNQANFLTRHPVHSLTIGLGVALFILASYGIKVYIDVTDDYDHDLLNQFNNTIIANSNTTCGEIFSPSSVCDEQNDYNLYDTLASSCASLLREFCHDLGSYLPRILYLTGSCLSYDFGFAAIAVSAIEIISNSRTCLWKDDRPFSSFSDEDQATIQRLFTQANEPQPDPGTTLRYILESKLTEIIERMEEKRDAIISEIDTINEEIEQSEKLYQQAKEFRQEKMRLFYNPYNHDPDLSKIMKQIPRGVMKNIMEQVGDPDKDYIETHPQRKHSL